MCINSSFPLSPLTSFSSFLHLFFLLCLCLFQFYSCLPSPSISSLSFSLHSLLTFPYSFLLSSSCIFPPSLFHSLSTYSLFPLLSLFLPPFLHAASFLASPFLLVSSLIQFHLSSLYSCIFIPSSNFLCCIFPPSSIPSSVSPAFFLPSCTFPFLCFKSCILFSLSLVSQFYLSSHYSFVFISSFILPSCIFLFLLSSHSCISNSSFTPTIHFYLFSILSSLPTSSFPLPSPPSCIFPLLSPLLPVSPLLHSLRSISRVFPSSVLQSYNGINKLVEGDKKTRQ